MQMRPCLSSASRSHLMSRKSEKYSGSKPAFPTMSTDWHAGAVRNGMAFDGFATPMLTTPQRACAGAADPML